MEFLDTPENVYSAKVTNYSLNLKWSKIVWE